MPSLRELQRNFMQAVLGDSPDLPATIGVYARNASTNFSNALGLSYPVIRRLVGAAYFEQCARGFHRENPSRCGDLHPAGASFPDYLHFLHHQGDYRYLADVARLEWLLQEAWLAAEHAPLEVARLAAVPPSDYEDLKFFLHPSLRLFESIYPCVAIWQANSVDEDPPVIDLTSAPREYVVILCGGELLFLTSSAGEHAFLAALQRHASFASAVEAGCNAGAFDAGAALRRFVAAAAIVDFR